MFGFDLLTILVIVATIVTFIIFFVADVFWQTGSEAAEIVTPIFGFLLAAEILYLIVRFVKFVWFL